MLWLMTDLLSGWPVGWDATRSTSVNRQQQEMIAWSSGYGLDLASILDRAVLALVGGEFPWLGCCALRLASFRPN